MKIIFSGLVKKMGFLSLYRKYRPQKFSDLVGQDYVVQTLSNALQNDRIVHAYLFSGPRGTGKTSTAKVFAKALNCKEESTLEPCTECENCIKIQTGQSIDVIEIDAASNRGIDEIRDLREKVKFYPGEGNYKVYIIDEVHMLTKSAFNALLKTLEEPPENVVFILATTEPHEVITTVLSRCQRFDFSLLSVSEIQERLIYICNQEEVEYEEDALNVIAHSSDGGLRDAISILDQAISYTDSNLTLESVTKMLGKVNKKILSQFIKCVVNNNTTDALELVNELIEKGKGVARFVTDLIEHSRQLLLIKQCGINSGLLQYSKSRMKLMKKESKVIGLSALLRTINILTEVEKDLKFSNQPRLILEIGVVKLTSPEADDSVESLQTRVSELEYKLRQLKETDIKSGQSQLAEKSAKKDKSVKKNKNVDSVNNNIDNNDKNITNNNRKENKVKEENKVESKEKNDKKEDDIVKDHQTKNQTNQSSTGDFNIDDVRKAWPTILSKVKEEDIQTRAYLIEGKPKQVVDNTVYIEFSKEKKFHKNGAQKRKKLITKKFNHVLSRNCSIRFILEGEEISKKKLEDNISNSSQESQNKKDMTDDQSSAKDLAEKIAKMFDGDIVRVNEEHLET